MLRVREFGNARTGAHFIEYGLWVYGGFVAIRREFGVVGTLAAAQGKQVGNRPACFGHAAVGPVHEHGAQRTQVLARAQLAFLVHIRQRMQRLVDVAGRRILAVENWEILDVVRFGTILAAEAHHRLAEIHDPIVGGGTRTNQVHDRELRIFFEQHRHGAGALGGLAAGASCIFRNVGADHDRLAASAIEGQVPDRSFHSVNTAQAGVLELGYLTAARNRRQAACLEGPVDHALYDDCAGGIVGARFGTEPKELDARGVDVVLVNKSHDGRCRHRVDAVIRAAHAKTAPDDFPQLGPMTAGPLAPILKPDAVRRYVGCEA